MLPEKAIVDIAADDGMDVVMMSTHDGQVSRAE
jgi:hypothetical protein